MSEAGLYTPRRKKIALTALIDVVFILLMFFMLTSSFSQWNAIEFKSPVLKQVNTDSQTQYLLLNADSSVSLSNNSFSRESFLLISSSDIQFFTQDPIVLIPEATVDIQTIINAIEHSQMVGLPTITLGNSRPSITKNL